VPISSECEGPIKVLEEHASAAVAKLVTGGSALLIASAAGNALNYAFGIFVARMLGVEQFGRYALGLTVFNLLVLLAPLALDIGVIKLVSGQLTLGETGRVRRTIINVGMIAGASGLLAGLGLVFFTPFLSTSIYHKPELSGVLLFFAAAIPFATLSTVLLGALQGFQTVRYTILIKYLWEPVGKFLLVAIALTFGFGLYGVLGSLVIVFAVSTLLVLQSIRRALPSDDGGPRHERAMYQSLMAFSVPLMISNLFGALAPRSDILLLGYWVDAKQVGIYNAAFQTSAIIGLIIGAFDTAIVPVIGSLISRGDDAALKTLYQVTSRWALTLSMPIFLLMAIWGREVLGLFGPAYTAGSACLLILSLAQLINGATGTTSSIILMSGHSRTILVNSLLVGPLLIGANLFLISRYGISGAALASASCQILVSLMRVGQVWYSRRLLPFSWVTMKPVAAGLIALAVGWLMKGHFGAGYSSQLLFAGLVLGGFCNILFLLGIDEAESIAVSGLWKRLATASRFSRT